MPPQLPRRYLVGSCSDNPIATARGLASISIPADLCYQGGQRDE